MKLTQRLEEILKRCEAATKVVKWYDHGLEDGTVRGPFCRWFKCSYVESKYSANVSPVEDDVAFAATAMNNIEAVTQALMKAVEGLIRLSKPEKCPDWDELQTYDDIICAIASDTLAEIASLLSPESSLGSDSEKMLEKND